MKHKLIIIIPIIVVALILIISGLILNNASSNESIDDSVTDKDKKYYKYDVNKFQHRNIDELNFKAKKADNDYEVDYDIYDEELQDNYYAAKLYYEDTIIIEENVLDVESGDNSGNTWYSILYSDQELDRNYIYRYLDQMHDYASCGIEIDNLKKIDNHYYYVRFRPPDEC